MLDAVDDLRERPGGANLGMGSLYRLSVLLALLVYVVLYRRIDVGDVRAVAPIPW